MPNFTDWPLPDTVVIMLCLWTSQKHPLLETQFWTAESFCFVLLANHSFLGILPFCMREKVFPQVENYTALTFSLRSYFLTCRELFPMQRSVPSCKPSLYHLEQNSAYLCEKEASLSPQTSFELARFHFSLTHFQHRPPALCLAGQQGLWPGQSSVVDTDINSLVEGLDGWEHGEDLLFNWEVTLVWNEGAWESGALALRCQFLEQQKIGGEEVKMQFFLRNWRQPRILQTSK